MRFRGFAFPIPRDVGDHGDHGDFSDSYCKQTSYLNQSVVAGRF
jgi:hypothetical protein